jgi:amidohydrolase
MLFVGTGRHGGAGSSLTLHHPRFLPPDDAVGQVARVMLAGYLAAFSVLLVAWPQAAVPTVHSATI